MTGRGFCNDNKGFTLIELIVVMGLFIVIIMISAGAFEKIANISSQQIKSAESNIQGVVGLEIMRSDLEHSGYGLAWELPFVANFQESEVGANGHANGIDPKAFNDTNTDSSIDSNKVPRAIQSAAAAGAGDWENGRDYLVIKSAYVGMNQAAKKWSYIEGTGASSVIKQWGADDFAKNDRVIVLDSKTRRLIAASDTDFSFTVGDDFSLGDVAYSAYQPTQDTDVYLLYGINAANNLRVPFNRVDYFIKKPIATRDIPARCAPGTGTLYKAPMNHNDGKATQYPLLDCVADMQVIYSLDSNEDDGVDVHVDSISAMSSADIRKQLKEIRVYVLTHEGQRDRSFNYPSSTVYVGEFASGRTYDLTKLENIGDSWKNYRWKVYTLVVDPKNIND